MARESQPFLGRTALSVHLSWMQHSTPCVVIRDHGAKVLRSSHRTLMHPEGPLSVSTAALAAEELPSVPTDENRPLHS